MVRGASVSLLVHASVFTILAGLWAGVPHDPAPQFGSDLQTAWTPVDTAIAPVQILPLAPPRGVDGPPGGSSPGPMALDTETQEGVSVAAPTLVSATGTAGAVETKPDAVPGIKGGKGRKGKLSAGRGKGTGTGEGDGAGDAFFGVRSPGRRVVFVVDASRSMRQEHADSEQSRFQKVQTELVRTIGGMDATMQFFIIFFNDVAIPMPAEILQPAEPGTQQHFLRWAAMVEPDGGTDPRQAMALAVQLRPDVIYFLTDGAFRPPVRDFLRDIKQNRTSINTLAFGNRESEELLRRLAATNRGQYQYLP